MLKVCIIQINNSFSGQYYFPYAAGLLEAYALANCNSAAEIEFLDPIFKREPVDLIIPKITDADVVGFSVYVWNHEICLRIARQLKQVNSKVTILFGGPHVPDNAEEYIRENNFIDICLHGEGEATFAEVLDTIVDGKTFHNIGSLSFLDIGNRYVRTPNRKRLNDLNLIPSPYLTGRFNKIMKDNPDYSWIGLWETNRGCPFKCTFCDWGSATAAKVYKFDLDRIYAEIKWFSENKVEFIFCCDANFGMLERDIDIVNVVKLEKEKTGYPQSLSVQSTKNATDRAFVTQKILADAGLNKGVSLSMQSMDEATLSNIKRDNISLETYNELQNRFTKANIETYSDLILALPGETYHSLLKGIDKIIDSGQHNRIQFNNLSILPNSEMGNPEYQKQFGMETISSVITNFHGVKSQAGEIEELQKLVVATKSMPREDWLQTRSMCFLISFLYFDKLLQIPIILIRKILDRPFSTIFSAFYNADATEYPMIKELIGFFRAHAEDMQNGGSEYVFSEKWLGIYWPADEYSYIKLVDEAKIDDFYVEATRLLQCLAPADRKSEMLTNLINEAVIVNRTLLKLPYPEKDVELSLSFDILGYYKEALTSNNEIVVTPQEKTIIIPKSQFTYDSFNDWARFVVWYGNKKGAYLITQRDIDKQLAGIF